MSLGSHVQRALTASSSHSPLLVANARTTKREAQRLSRNAATLSYPQDDAPSAFDIQIFDIFDAPSRLGESSKLLRREHTSSHAPSSARSIHSSAQKERASRTIRPLPAPITYDGPARPKHMSMMAYRAPRNHSSSSMSAEVSSESQSSFTSLPPPVTFDGPSRLRPYPRTSSHSSGNAASASSSQSALLIGGAGLALYAGNEYYKSTKQQPRNP
ncbi:hypothetical protein BXZ70DRAFT_56814 [Cristinia sonorae]|uniref:Uncharacterized protein n=1 Tax=Cristinia sonorae TaxID=1940300 RepID=A0A8K0US83_9AGAR|nr:hypothetical protein BXZ70DRAFT_56814 [Cristinia sonorae]